MTRIELKHNQIFTVGSSCPASGRVYQLDFVAGSVVLEQPEDGGDSLGHPAENILTFTQKLFD